MGKTYRRLTRPQQRVVENWLDANWLDLESRRRQLPRLIAACKRDTKIEGLNHNHLIGAARALGKTLPYARLRKVADVAGPGGRDLLLLSTLLLELADSLGHEFSEENRGQLAELQARHQQPVGNSSLGETGDE